MDDLILIGISGGRGAGKSTISNLLVDFLQNSKLITCDSYMNEYSKKLEEDIFKKLDIKKDSNIFSYNYYFENYENMKTWIKVIEKDVINQVDNEIKRNIDKKFIIVDWCFLPLCDFFNKCDFNICVKTNFDIREKRLTERILKKDDKTDCSIDLYTPENFKRTIELTDFSEKGFDFDYYINNDSTLEILNKKVKEIVDNICAN